MDLSKSMTDYNPSKSFIISQRNIIMKKDKEINKAKLCNLMNNNLFIFTKVNKFYK